jgi:peroxiredoxin
MKTRLLALALICTLGFADAAQAPKKEEKKAAPPKSAADLALDEFNKTRTAPGAKDQARFQKVINTGLAFLMANPTHGSAAGAVNNLAFYPAAIDKGQPAQRTAYLSLLKLEVTNFRYKEGISDNAKAVLAAIDAAIADWEVREQPTPGNFNNLREKIDALAETPGGGRFLTEREQSFSHLVALGMSPARAETHLQKLTEHKEKGVKDMARAELNILELKKAPYGLKFTALDGKPVDFAQFRGKVVAMYFWMTTNRNIAAELERLRVLHSNYRKRGFEVVTVSYDKEEDREKLLKFIKDNRIAFPVYYDGKAAKNDFSPKLNLYSTPRMVVFDKEGILQTRMAGNPVPRLIHAFDMGQGEGVVRQLLEPQKKK